MFNIIFSFGMLTQLFEAKSLLFSKWNLKAEQGKINNQYNSRACHLYNHKMNY